MTCLLVDGLDWATTTGGFATAWPSIGQLDSTDGRQGGNAFSGAGDNATIARRNLGVPIPAGRTFYLGWHMKCPSPGDEGGFDDYLRIRNAAGQTLIELESDFQGTGRAFINNTATSLGVTFPYYSPLSANTYGRFELIANCDTGGSGRVQFFINGTKYFDATGLTFSLGDNDVDHIIWYASAPSSQRVYLDDIVIFDNQGDENVAAFDAPLGSFLIETIEANGVGTSSAWTPLGGGNNYEEIDEADPDGDTSYVQTDTDGNQDLYAFGAAGNARTVYAIEVNVIAALDTGSADAGLRGLAKSGTTTQSTDAQTVDSESYGLYEFSFPLDPDTASDGWDQTSIGAAEFGIEFEETI